MLYVDDYDVSLIFITKVKLFLYLTKYHAMKTHSMHNWTRRHEDVLGGGGTVPHILNLGTRRRWVVKFTLRPLRPWYTL